MPSTLRRTLNSKKKLQILDIETLIPWRWNHPNFNSFSRKVSKFQYFHLEAISASSGKHRNFNVFTFKIKKLQHFQFENIQTAMPSTWNSSGLNPFNVKEEIQIQRTNFKFKKLKLEYLERETPKLQLKLHSS